MKQSKVKVNSLKVLALLALIMAHTYVTTYRVEAQLGGGEEKTTSEATSDTGTTIASGLVQFELQPIEFPASLTYNQVFTDLMNVTVQIHDLFAPTNGGANHDTYINGAFGRDALFLADEGIYYRIYLSGYEGLVPKEGVEGTVTRTIQGITAEIKYRTVATYYPFPEQITSYHQVQSKQAVPELEYADQTLTFTSRELPGAQRIIQQSSNHTANVPSYYMIQDGMLYRYLTTDVVAGSYQFFRGIIPEEVKLEPNVPYYSYDGIFFYEYIRDIRIDGTGAVNEGEPYYNYYQFLSLRSQSTYEGQDLENYITDILDEGEVSALRGAGEHFATMEDEYGVNPALQLAFGIHESARGTSNLALNNNNLFGIRAIDADPEGNGTYFNTVEACISAHARDWISQYLHPTDWRYGGPHLGNKGSGMNMQYASDPYWGEKIAGWYYRLDAHLGQSELNNHTIGVLPTATATTVTEINGNVLYTAARGQISLRNFPFLILSQNEQHYQIRTDPPIVNGSVSLVAADYHFETAIGYIPAATNLVILGKTPEEGATAGLEFNFYSWGTAEVIGYTGSSRDVIIPSTVTNNGVDYTVTSIRRQALQDKNLTSLKLPITVTHIPDFAFVNNPLENVVISNINLTFGMDPFRFNQLQYITVPVGTAEIMKSNLNNSVMGADNYGAILREGTTPMYQWNRSNSWELIN